MTKLKTISKLKSMLLQITGQLPETPIHLRGLPPAKLAPNQLMAQLVDEKNLELAFQWLCEQTQESHHNSDVWDYRRVWHDRKVELRVRLLQGDFEFQTVSLVQTETELGNSEQHELRCAEDRLVIRAITQVLQPVLQPLLSKQCHHLKGNGGIHQAVRDIQAEITARPTTHIIKSDIKGYYAHIDHVILAEQLRYLLPDQSHLHRLLWNFMRRDSELGDNFRQIMLGIPRGASLSPLLAAVYLSPLDALAKQQGGFYRRYMDDWAWVIPKRHALRKAMKMQYDVLQALNVKMHPDKTTIGTVAKGFDFLGFRCCPTGITVSDVTLSRRDGKIAQLYEQGASKRRIGRYLVRWLGWVFVGLGVSGSVGAVGCTSMDPHRLSAFPLPPLMSFKAFRAPGSSFAATCDRGTPVAPATSCVRANILVARFPSAAALLSSGGGCDFQCGSITCAVRGGALGGLPVELLNFEVH